MNWAIPYSEVKKYLAFQLGHTLFRSKNNLAKSAMHKQAGSWALYPFADSFSNITTINLPLGSVSREIVPSGEVHFRSTEICTENCTCVNLCRSSTYLHNLLSNVTLLMDVVEVSVETY